MPPTGSLVPLVIKVGRSFGILSFRGPELRQAFQNAVHHTIAKRLPVQRITQKPFDLDLIGCLPIAPLEVRAAGRVEIVQ
jgi:hypothetical protein